MTSILHKVLALMVIENKRKSKKNILKDIFTE